MSGTPAIEVEGLRKSFGEVVALDGLDLLGAEGEVFALLGPNGAGKTTLVRALAYTQTLDDHRVLGRSAPSATPSITRWPRASSTASRPS